MKTFEQVKSEWESNGEWWLADRDAERRFFYNSGCAGGQTEHYALLCEIEQLRTELTEWKRKFHDRCDVQLDEFRKIGMVEAAKQCIEIAEPRDKHVAKMLRKEFNITQEAEI